MTVSLSRRRERREARRVTRRAGAQRRTALPAVAASGNTSSNEKMSRSFSPESASGRRSVSQDVSSDVRLSMTRNARAWRAGMVTTGAAVTPSEMAGRVNGSAVLRFPLDPFPNSQSRSQVWCSWRGPGRTVPRSSGFVSDSRMTRGVRTRAGLQRVTHVGGGRGSWGRSGRAELVGLRRSDVCPHGVLAGVILQPTTTSDDGSVMKRNRLPPGML